MTSPSTPPNTLKTPLKTQFAVDLHCESCVKTVKTALSPLNGIRSLDISVPNKTVTIEATTPPSLLFRTLRSTGLNTILRGQSSSAQHLGAAVCIFESFPGATGWAQTNNKGLARMVQVDDEICLVDVTVDGMPPGELSVSLHECGDISGGCESTGKALKEFGKLLVDASGRGDLVVESGDVKVWDVIGRSIVLENLQSSKQSEIPRSNSVCGIIARSAGVFENPKTVCSCSGKTLWQESTAHI
ncbi:hypothetical protein SpCBS45565_g03580 [Spizellomyces sp. 'palustris']|nr:hypothetical protein SpCBS45565_g03580 [Spizellomyces sp. 'palustris']